MSSISRTEYKYCLYRVQMWRFLTGVKPPPRKKAKLSETDARSEKENRKREPQKTWKDKRPWLQFTPEGTMICSYCIDAKIPEIRNKLREKCQRNRHIPKVSVPQRRQSASSVGRKGITVSFADQRVTMYVLMSSVSNSLRERGLRTG